MIMNSINFYTALLQSSHKVKRFLIAWWKKKEVRLNDDAHMWFERKKRTQAGIRSLNASSRIKILHETLAVVGLIR